ncbi:MAG: M48 family metalloprotease [Terriglobales bacterium]
MAWQMVASPFGVAPLTPAELARARQYLYGGLAWGVASQCWMFALLAAAYFGGCTEAFRSWLERRIKSAWAITALVTAALFAVVLGLLLPFDFYIAYHRERVFGFQHLTVAAWFGQWGISLVLTTVVGVIAASVAYAWMRRTSTGARPRAGGPVWWMKIWIVLAVGVVLGVAVDPILIAPLFHRFTPLPNGPVRTEIEQLARKAGIPHAEILVVNASADSAHTNAYVVGILGSQRIVIYDTLLHDETPAEIEFTVGHEIGHYVLHHLWKGIAFTVALLWVFCAILGWLYPKWAVRSRGRSPWDPAGVPLILLILLGLLFLAAPATNGFSRWEEHQADAYGLRLSQQPRGAITGFEREEHTDLIYPDPPGWIIWWFFTHPSQQERIDFARAVR